MKAKPEFVTNPVGPFSLSTIKDGQSAGLHFGHLHQSATDFRLSLIQHDHIPVRIHQPDRTSVIVERGHHSDTVHHPGTIADAFGFFLLKTCVGGYCEQSNRMDSAPDATFGESILKMPICLPPICAEPT